MNWNEQDLQNYYGLLVMKRLSYLTFFIFAAFSFIFLCLFFGFAISKWLFLIALIAGALSTVVSFIFAQVYSAALSMLSKD